MTDYPDWTDPQATATDVSVTGVPLLRKTAPLASASNVNIAAGSSINPVSNVAINQPSYEIFFGVSLPAGVGTVPFLQILFQWFDAATGFITDTEVFQAPMGNGPANNLQYYMQGPARGSGLNLLFQNSDPAQVATITYVITMTSHVHAYDRFTQFGYANVAPIGFSNPAGQPNAGVLAVINAAIAGNGNIQRLCAVWSGVAIVTIDNGGAANSMSLTIEDPGTLYSTIANAHLYKFFISAGVESSFNIALPHGPVLLVAANNAAGTITPTISLTRIEY